MISESMQQSHGSLYFEVLAACEDNAVVGFTSLSARSEHIISCSPAIKTQHQGQGLGFAAETQALAYAKRKGYTIAVATIDEQNAASIALHEKLGFELAKQYRSKQGTFRLYAKAL